MKILLIAPASGQWRHVGRHRFLNGRTFRFSLLSLLSVAAESPPDADVQIVDEQIDDIPWDADVDLVGITCMTALRRVPTRLPTVSANAGFAWCSAACIPRSVQRRQFGMPTP